MVIQSSMVGVGGNGARVSERWSVCIIIFIGTKFTISVFCFLHRYSTPETNSRIHTEQTLRENNSPYCRFLRAFHRRHCRQLIGTHLRTTLALSVAQCRDVSPACIATGASQPNLNHCTLYFKGYKTNSNILLSTKIVLFLALQICDLLLVSLRAFPFDRISVKPYKQVLVNLS